MVVHLVLTESYIPENWQAEDELNSVCRMMLPDEKGTKTDFANNDEITLDYLIELDSSWNYDELEIMAIVQDNGSHEILNATKSNFAELIGILENLNSSFKLKTWPNPFSTATNISFELENSTNVNIEIFDITEKIVDQIKNQKMTEGNQIINWKPNLSPGIFFVKITTDKRIEIIKIVKQ